MHPFLSRLRIKPEVQEFFSPSYYADGSGNLCFDYGTDFEHYGFAFHRIPVVHSFWMAGNLVPSQVTQVILCGSALECIAWLDHHWDRFSETFSLLFLSIGASLCGEQIKWLREFLPGKITVFAFGNQLLGRLAAIKLAAGIRSQQLQIVSLAEEKIQIRFRARTFLFSPENISLNRLERASGFRFRVRIAVPINYNSFFEQQKAAAGLSF